MVERQNGAGEVSLLGVVNAVLRHRRLLVGLPLLTATVAALIAALAPSNYLAVSRFAPLSARRSDNQLAGLAAQFGVAIGSSSNAESLEFYAELLKSHELLRAAANSVYTVPGETSGRMSRTLVDIYEVQGGSADARVSAAARQLGEAVSARVDARAGLVTLRTEAASPALATQINRRLLQLVNEFNLDRRRERAAEEREFIESRLESAQAELQRDEGALQQFMQRNRRFESSPELVFEANRLQRRVDLRQQVYASLSQAYEQARIDEVRATPLLSVIDAPENSAVRSANSPLVSLLFGLILGSAVAVIIILAREYMTRQRHDNPEELAEFDALKGLILPRLARVRLTRVRSN